MTQCHVKLNVTQNTKRRFMNLKIKRGSRKTVAVPHDDKARMLKWPLYARIDHTARGRFKRVADASRRTDGD